MKQKIARLSYNQLVLLQFLLKNADKIVTVRQIERGTPLKQKVLGGTLSSLSRTQFRGRSLIEPMGRSTDHVGLRWKLNTEVLDVAWTRAEVARILRSYV